MNNKLFKGEVNHIWAADPEALKFPPDELPEVAFIGRSNVGKSTLINAVMGRNKLARTSSNPGATRLLHFYEIPENFMVVDLPGYGYAKISKQQSADIAMLTQTYFSERRSLKKVFVLIDSRRGIKDVDIATLKLLVECGVQSQIILTKADKTRPAELKAVTEKVKATIAEFVGVDSFVISTSSAKKKGIEDVQYYILETCGLL